MDFDGLCGDGGRDLNEAHAGRGVEVEVDAGAGARVEDDAASAAVLMEDDFGFGGEHPGLDGSLCGVVVALGLAVEAAHLVLDDGVVGVAGSCSALVAVVHVAAVDEHGGEHLAVGAVLDDGGDVELLVSAELQRVKDNVEAYHHVQANACLGEIGGLNARQGAQSRDGGEGCGENYLVHFHDRREFFRRDT